MSSLKELIAQKEALEQKIAEAKQNERADAIARVRALMAEHGLTAADLVATGKGKARARSGKVAAKYRDAATGQTWTGRGRAPKWIEGKSRDDYLIR